MALRHEIAEYLLSCDDERPDPDNALLRLSLEMPDALEIADTIIGIVKDSL